MTRTFVVHETHEIDYMPPRQLAVELMRSAPTVIVGRPRRLGLRAGAETADSRRFSIPEIVPVELPRRWGLNLVTDTANAWMWRNAVRKAIGRHAEAVVLFDRPVQHHRVGVLGEEASAYYAHCDYTVDILGRHEPQAAADELMMLRKVDVAFAASPLLVERFSKHAKRVVHLPCGYSAEMFDGDRIYDVPAALQDLPRPRILFCGYISGRVDFLGLLETVKARPEWTFVFLGGVSAGLADQLVASGRDANLFQRICERPNVHCLGRVPLEMVPPYMAACDVGLVPYCLSDFTMTSSPQKTFEYLALGKPIVATAIPETTHVADDIVLASEGASYAPAIEKALLRVADPLLIEKRKAAGRQNSMAVRAKAVIDALAARA